MTPAESLKERFEKFVRTLSGYEDVDSLLRHNRNANGKKRADYLFNGRDVIMEQKSLEIDPGDKPQKFIDKLIGERRIIVYGRVSTNQIFDKMADGKQQYWRLIQRMTGSVEDQVSKADKQARDTREIFGVPKALGVLVFLNTSAPTLDHELLRYRIFDLFKVLPDRNVRFVHNDLIVTITEHDPVKIGAMRYPRFESFTNSVSKRKDDANTFAVYLKDEWNAINGGRYVGQVGELPSLNLYDKT